MSCPPKHKEGLSEVFRLTTASDVFELLGVSQLRSCSPLEIRDKGGLHVTYYGKRAARYMVNMSDVY
jgi:hypothetical protein